jgi:anti-anti-sigma regulatory factor
VQFALATRILREKGHTSVDADSVDAAIISTRDESGGVLTLRGAFHLDLAPELHRVALELSDVGGGVVVECSQMEHLDGCAAQILLALKLALERRGGSLRMKGVSRKIDDYLIWSGLAVHFADGAPGAGAAEAAIAAPSKRRRSPRKPSS